MPAAHPLTDHDEIRSRAEARNATPSCVRGTGGNRRSPMMRLDFPGYSGEESLEEISSDQGFEKLHENDLALLVQDRASGGEKSDFNELVTRETAQRDMAEAG